MIRKYIRLLIALCLMITIIFTSDALADKSTINSIVLDNLHRFNSEFDFWSFSPYMNFKTSQSNFFVNYYDGYTFTYDDSFEYNADNFSNRVRFESADITVDIFHEVNLVEGYVNYTNQGVLNNCHLKVTENRKSHFEGGDFSVLKWNRQKLSRINNDKNFYVKYDITTQNDAYTILIKSTENIENSNKYISSFNIIEKQEFDKDYIESLDKKLYVSQRNWNEETEEFYKTYFLQSDDITWGIFYHNYSIDKTALKRCESKIDYKFPIVLHYTGISQSYSKKVEDFLNSAYKDGKYVELTLQPPLNGEPQNMLFDVLDGKYDKFLTDYAKAVKKFNHPVLLRLFNEMNGDWCEYSSYMMSIDTDIYIELYRYVADFFKDADNVIYVWNPNGKSFPDFNWNDAFLHYPGDDYVDIVGMTMYNTGDYYEGEVWSTFDELYEDIYKRYSMITDMPLMITEFACARAGGDKEAWTEDMFEKIKKYKRIKVAVWWSGADFDTNGSVARSYYIDDSKEMIDIFKNNMKSE